MHLCNLVMYLEDGPYWIFLMFNQWDWDLLNLFEWKKLCNLYWSDFPCVNASFQIIKLKVGICLEARSLSACFAFYLFIFSCCMCHTDFHVWYYSFLNPCWKIKMCDFMVSKYSRMVMTKKSTLEWSCTASWSSFSLLLMDGSWLWIFFILLTKKKEEVRYGFLASLVDGLYLDFVWMN